MAGESDDEDGTWSAVAPGHDVGPALFMRDLLKRYGPVTAVDDVSLCVQGGVFLSLLGPSGSGKTTILRLIGGFESPDEGVIEIDGRDVTGTPPHRRNIGVVFQRYSLFPHLSVAENVAFPLKQRGVPRAERALRAAYMLETVGLDRHGDRRPAELSGGQQQRVALARALIYRPRLLVMDEPLAALDRNLRLQLQEEIKNIQRRTRITVLYITHDQTEAFAMSDLVAVMRSGRIEQVDTPRALYENPRTEFVAGFVGDSNLFRGEAIGSAAGVLETALPDGTRLRCRTEAQASGAVSLLVRPEKIRMARRESADPRTNMLHGKVVDATFLGDSISYRVSAAGQELRVRTPSVTSAGTFPCGIDVTLSWAIEDTIAIR